MSASQINIFIFFISVILVSGMHESSSFLPKTLQASQTPKLCGWFIETDDATEESIKANLSHFNSKGIECVKYHALLKNYPRAVKIAKSLKMRIYGWIPALLGTGQNKEDIYENHPEVFTVSHSGHNCYNQSFYGMDYYKFLCPNQPLVRDFLEKMYTDLLRVPDIDGISLDYIRYGETSIDKFDPEVDTCYCDVCKQKFLELTGIKIDDFSDPTTVPEWNKFRVDSISSLVNRIAYIAHRNSKKVSASIYPPSNSQMQTKQKWEDWDLDMVIPMLYMESFGGNPDWLGSETRNIKNKIQEEQKDTILLVGLLGEAENDQNFKAGVEKAMKNGADGISVFKLNSINEEKIEIAKSLLN